MPLKGSFKIDRALSTLSQRYANAEYIAGQIMKDVLVQRESDKYYIYNNDRRLEETVRANGTLSKQVGFDMSTSSYVLQEHALKGIVTDRDRQNVDEPINLDADLVEYLTDKIMLRMEDDVAKFLFTTTTWGNNATLVSETSWKYHTTTSAPIQNVLSATSYILSQGGGKANKAIMSIAVRDALKENINVHERIKYTQKSIVTEELLASMFDLDQVLVGSAVYNSSDEGIADSFSGLWGNHCLIGWFDPSPRLKTKTAAAMMRQSGRGLPMTVKRWREEGVEGDVIEVQTFYKPVAISTVSAYFLHSVAL